MYTYLSCLEVLSEEILYAILVEPSSAYKLESVAQQSLTESDDTSY